MSPWWLGDEVDETVSDEIPEQEDTASADDDILDEDLEAEADHEDDDLDDPPSAEQAAETREAEPEPEATSKSRSGRGRRGGSRRKEADEAPSRDEKSAEGEERSPASRRRSRGHRGRESRPRADEKPPQETTDSKSGNSRAPSGRGTSRGPQNGGRNGGREAARSTPRESPRSNQVQEAPSARRTPAPGQTMDTETAVGHAFESLAREVAALRGSVERASSQGEADERKIAVFFDFENLALGVRDSKRREKFEVQRVLERLLEKGKIIFKKAYADWERYAEYKRAFHEAAIELIEIPQRRYSGKNSADIKMVVDAMDLCYTREHLDTFVLVSGDSDFSPLVSKLRESDKHVIGIGVKNSTSPLLAENCDEFIYYEDLERDRQRVPSLDHLGEKDAELFSLLTEAMLALYREDKDVLWASMVKQTMRRKRPSFAESYFGYASFSEMLEDAQRKGVIRLEKDKGSGNYRIAGFGRR